MHLGEKTQLATQQGWLLVEEKAQRLKAPSSQLLSESTHTPAYTPRMCDFINRVCANF